jgi:ribonuclease P protein subunit POP4
VRPVKHVAKGELIGLEVGVVESGDPTLVGLEGVIVDETRNTFKIERASNGREATVPKRGQSFAFRTLEGERVQLDGEALSFAPQDRTKKAR